MVADLMLLMKVLYLRSISWNLDHNTLVIDCCSRWGGGSSAAGASSPRPSRRRSSTNGKVRDAHTGICRKNNAAMHHASSYSIASPASSLQMFAAAAESWWKAVVYLSMAIAAYAASRNHA